MSDMCFRVCVWLQEAAIGVLVSTPHELGLDTPVTLWRRVAVAQLTSAALLMARLGRWLP